MSESNDTIVPGTILADRYEIHEPIGHGGFGTVYRARQLNIDRDIAVKVLPKKFLTSTEVVERFRREAQLASRLRHPHTITIHDYGRHDDYLFIAMEYLEGEDLADVLHRERTLSIGKIVHIATQALKSLSEAHDHGIVHRDLKPENIFLSVVGNERDFIKVLDFGIAKFPIPQTPDPAETSDNPFRKQRQLTMSGSTVGTPIYMSPEQAAGEDVDALTDIYGLGIIMYEMACGRPPFYGENPVKIMRSHLFEEVPQFTDPALRDSPLERIILKALKKDKTQRYQNAGEFLAALTLEIDLSPESEQSGLFNTENFDDTEDEPVTLEMYAGMYDSEPFFSPPSDLHATPFDFTPPARDALRTTEPDLDLNELDSIPFMQSLDARREFVRQNATQSNSASSILTVLDSPLPDTGEVLLLTRPKKIVKKTNPIPRNASSVIAPVSTFDAAATGDFQRPRETPSPAISKITSTYREPQPQIFSSDSTPEAETWNWNDLPEAPASNTQPLQPVSNRKNLIAAVIILLIITAILAVLLL